MSNQENSKKLGHDVLRDLLKEAGNPDEVRAAFRELFDEIFMGGVGASEEALGATFGEEVTERCQEFRTVAIDGIMDDLEPVEVEVEVVDEDGDELYGMPVVLVDGTVMEVSETAVSRAKRAQSSDGKGKVSEGAPRTRYVGEVLEEMGVDKKTCRVYMKAGNGEGDEVEAVDYKLIYIPSLKKAVMVNDEGLRGTSVLYQCENPEDFLGITRAELSAMGLEGKSIQMHFVHGYDDNWKERLRANLEREKGNVGAIYDLDAPIECALDEAYFKDSDRVHTDLERFISVLPGVDDVFGLTTGTKGGMYSKRVQLTNGEVVSGSAYLEKAAEVFGYVDTSSGKKPACRIRPALARLKEIAGHILRDIDYYLNPKFAKADFESMLEAMKEVGYEPDSASNTHFGKYRDLEFEGANGETITIRKYLEDAARCYGVKPEGPEVRVIFMRVAGHNVGNGIVSNPSYSKDPVSLAYDIRSLSRTMNLPPRELLHASRRIRLGHFDARFNKSVRGGTYFCGLAQSYGMVGQDELTIESRHPSLIVDVLERMLVDVEAYGLDLDEIGGGAIIAEEEEAVVSDLEWEKNVIPGMRVALAVSALIEPRATNCRNPKIDPVSQRDCLELAGTYSEEFPEGEEIPVSQIVEKEIERALDSEIDLSARVERFILSLSIVNTLGHMRKKHGRVIEGLAFTPEMPILEVSTPIFAEMNSQLGFEVEEGAEEA